MEGGGGATGEIQTKATISLSPSSKEAFLPMWRPGPAGSAAAGSCDTSDGGERILEKEGAKRAGEQN